MEPPLFSAPTVARNALSLYFYLSLVFADQAVWALGFVADESPATLSFHSVEALPGRVAVIIVFPALHTESHKVSF
jgi:hypothetical protein